MIRDTSLTRRHALGLLAAVTTSACGGRLPDDGDGALRADNLEDEDAADGGPADDAVDAVDAGVDGGPADEVAGPWATEGTRAMTLAARYPDPFRDDVGACVITRDLTAGPCFAASPLRRDISEGALGVPVRLSLRVLDDACTPVAALVDVWHCGGDGLYTGDDASSFCTRDDAGARARRTFRGTQPTDTRGCVAFDTCFPGWYPGRAIHVHVRVRAAQGALATQVFFPEDVTAAIATTVIGYRERGMPDTLHAEDLLATEDDPASFILRIERMPDGAMLASKTLVVAG